MGPDRAGRADAGAPRLRRTSWRRTSAATHLVVSTGTGVLVGAIVGLTGAPLAGFLSAVTWVPALLLFTFQSCMSATPWAAKNMHIAVGMFAGALIWIVLLSLIALATASWVKWRIVATGMVFAAVFVPAGVGGVFNSVMHTEWGSVFNIPLMMTTLWRRLLQVDLPSFLTSHEIPTFAILVALTLICLGCVAALNARIRAREVVRG